MTAIRLTPDAWVFTGGTSSAPESISVLSEVAPIRLDICEHPAAKTIAVSTIPTDHIALCRSNPIRTSKYLLDCLGFPSCPGVTTSAPQGPDRLA
jgi:hypothetical protein